MLSSAHTTVLEIVTGRKKDGVLSNCHIAGHAFLETGSDYYRLKLMMFPRHSYFLKKNRDSENFYTVYSKRLAQDDTAKFLNPVGFGRLAKDLKTHLEVRFPLIRVSVFIDLFPKNSDTEMACAS